MNQRDVMDTDCTVTQIETDSSIAYGEGRYFEAAVLFDRAREEARAGNDRGRYLGATVWAGICYQLAGRPVRAMGLLMEVINHCDVQLSHWDQWLAHIQLCEVLRDYGGDRRTLSEQLHRLKALEGVNSCWARSDVLWLEAGALEAEGRWDDACRLLEQAWVAGRRTFMKFLIAEYAVRIHLAAGREQEARQWSLRLKETERYFSESRVAALEAQARLALWDCDRAALDCISRQLQHEAEGLQRPLWEGRALRIRIRASLLNPDLGDPMDLAHPARRLLRERPRGGVTREERFQQRLLLLDYRLACLRYAAGLLPQETLYGWRVKGDMMRHRPAVDECEFSQRLGKVTHAVKSARVRARSLDDNFDCHWREREVQRRHQVVEALAHECGCLCSAY
jgi:hypothetical protein